MNEIYQPPLRTELHDAVDYLFNRAEDFEKLNGVEYSHVGRTIAGDIIALKLFNEDNDASHYLVYEYIDIIGPGCGENPAITQFTKRLVVNADTYSAFATREAKPVEQPARSGLLGAYGDSLLDALELIRGVHSLDAPETQELVMSIVREGSGHPEGSFYSYELSLHDEKQQHDALTHLSLAKRLLETTMPQE